MEMRTRDVTDAAYLNLACAFLTKLMAWDDLKLARREYDRLAGSEAR